MNLDERMVALLELVEQFRARRHAELIEPARAEARETIRIALAESRRRVRTAIAEERKRYATEVGAVEAALATDRRLASQRHSVRLLGDAWHALRERLVARWDHPETRAQWVAAHLDRALKAVPHQDSGWQIEHHPAWSQQERGHACDRLRIDGITPVQFEATEGIAAGFRVISGHNVLDATLDGLVADRTQLEGRLLHHLEPVAAPDQAEAEAA
jgi:hypothetical protein